MYPSELVTQSGEAEGIAVETLWMVLAGDRIPEDSFAGVWFPGQERPDVLPYPNRNLLSGGMLYIQITEKAYDQVRV